MTAHAFAATAPSGIAPLPVISRDVARLFLVRRHFLAPPRSLPPGPASVLAVIDRLGSLQFDTIDVAGRNHDLVLLSRIRDYRREWTDALLYEERGLFEAYNKGLSILPTSELPWYRLTWDRNRERLEADVFPKYRTVVDEVLGRIRDEGALGVTDFPVGELIDWYWRPTNVYRAMLEGLAQAGILGLAGRRANQRRYDLTERLFPAELLAQVQDPFAQRRHRLLSRFRAHGLLGRSGSAELWLGAAPGRRTADYDGPTRAELLEDLLAGGDLLPVTIDGIKGERFVVAEDASLLRQTARDVAGFRPGVDRASRAPIDPGSAGVAFLAPLDPFVWDRDFIRRVFEFDYLWEVYVPERRRQWGYYVLPLLWGDRLVGRIEPKVDRRADTLRILGVWWETGFEPLEHPAFVAGLAEALEAHRAFADVGRVVVERSTGRMSRLQAVREAIRLLPAPPRLARRISANRGTIRATTSRPTD